MKKSLVVIGAVAGASLLAAGWALADPSNGPMAGHGMGLGMAKHGGDREETGRGQGAGHGMMGGRMGSGMGPGMMGHGMTGGQMGAGPMGQGGERHGGMGPGAGTDRASLDDARGQLGITATQEAAWTKYADAVREATEADATARRGVDPTVAGRLTPQERFEYGARLRDANQAGAEKVRAAANELLATLDDAQKAKAQSILPGLGATRGPVRGAEAGHGPMGGPGMGRGMQGHN